MKNLLKSLLVLGLALLLPAAVLGQAISGDVVGIVKDSTGALVANATVDATNLSTGYKTSTATNTSGEYHFVNLPAGHYSVQAASGSLKGGYADLAVELNRTVTANITTSVAGTATTVEVSEQATSVNTTNAQIETTFSAKELQDSPLASSGGLGSGVLNLSLLNAGVASNGGIGAGSGPSVSGQRPRNNNFTVEGVDNNNKAVTGPLLMIPNDSVDNFTVLQNQFSPEFGHSSGGQFNLTIKSGTNQFHGRAWEYFQNRNLNAIDSQTALSQVGSGITPFNPRFDDNRFGGQIGGPIIKDKLFFFTMWQYEPIGQVGTPSTGCSPTAAGYSTLGAMFPNSNNLSTFQKYVPAAGSQSPGSSSGDVCPSAVSVLGNNIPVGDVGFIGPSYQNFLTNVNSGDWNISSKDSLRVRYAFENNTGFDTAAQLSSFWTTTPTKYNLFTLGEYHNFTQNVNNEFRFGFNRFNQPIPVSSQTFPGLNVFPNIVVQELNGIQLGPDPNGPQFTIQNTYQAVDTVSWVKGKHNFKFGGEFRWSISPQEFTQRSRGDYEWNTMEGYLLDIVPDFLAERSAGTFTYYGNQNNFYTFANDEWKVKPNLTLSLGLRYELTTVPLSQTQAQPLNAISSVPGLITFGAPQKQTTNFLPRIGFAWSPGESGTTSIRGGFGMAVDVLYDNLGILSMPPQVQQTCDAPGPMTSTCFWNPLTFMAGGGLPSNQPAPFTSAADARAATSAFIPNQKLPYSETWNLGVQHMFAQKYTLDVRYVGTRGIHLPVQTRLNAQSPVTSTSFLPTFTSNPGQAYLDSLTTTLAGLKSVGSLVPAWGNAGFNGANVVAFEPWGSSNYNGLQVSFKRNFTNGLQFQSAFTWSHAFDNSTADVFSTVLTPRRPQDFQCFSCDYGTSALDHRLRATLAVTYDLPFFKNDNWFMKNVVGNWQFSPIYTFQSPEYATVQSNADSNLNGDSAPDRAIVNPSGVVGTSTTVTSLMNSSGATVAYLADNPNAYYIQSGAGALATDPRNTLGTRVINNWDFALLKRVNITERQSVQFIFQATNVFNHAQYVPGLISDVQSFGQASATVRGALLAGSPTFNNWQDVFSNHPRNLVLVLKYSF